MQEQNRHYTKGYQTGNNHRNKKTSSNIQSILKSSPSPTTININRLLANHRRQKTPLIRRMGFVLTFAEQRHRGVRVDALPRIRDLQRPFGVFFVEPKLSDHHGQRAIHGVEYLCLYWWLHGDNGGGDRGRRRARDNWRRRIYTRLVEMRRHGR